LLGFFSHHGVGCELNIDDRQQVWHISADIETHAFTARSKSEKPITHRTAMMTVEHGFPDTLDLVFTEKSFWSSNLMGMLFCRGSTPPTRPMSVIANKPGLRAFEGYFRDSPLKELARSNPSEVMSRYSTSAVKDREWPARR